MRQILMPEIPEIFKELDVGRHFSVGLLWFWMTCTRGTNCVCSGQLFKDVCMWPALWDRAGIFLLSKAQACSASSVKKITSSSWWRAHLPIIHPLRSLSQSSSPGLPTIAKWKSLLSCLMGVGVWGWSELLMAIEVERDKQSSSLWTHMVYASWHVSS